MHKQTIAVAVIALIIGGVGGYAIAEMGESHGKHGYDRDDRKGHSMDRHEILDPATMSDPDTGMGDMAAMGQMDHSAMMVGSEREFIIGMIPHHQEAIDTAQEVVARGGTTPEIKQLAEDIIIAQAAEIAEMKQWHLDWYGEEYIDTGEYMPMMRELETLSGAELDHTFLRDMIPHHMGAIMMVESVQPYIEHDEIKILTENIVASQSAEIAQMRELLQGF